MLYIKKKVVMGKCLHIVCISLKSLPIVAHGWRKPEYLWVDVRSEANYQEHKRIFKQ